MTAEGINIGSSVVISLVTALGVAIVFMFKLYVASKARQIQMLEDRAKTFEEIATEAIKSAKETADYYRGKYENLAPIILATPVVSEGNSPSTVAQRRAAVIGTMRASLASIKRHMGQSPRPEPERSNEKE